MKSINIQKLSGLEFIHFICSRSSFFQYYKQLHNDEKEQVLQKINIIVRSPNFEDFIQECRILFQAATQLKEKPTYYFDKWVGDLVEMYYSNESFTQNKKEIEPNHIIHIDKDPISLEWVLQANILTRYERYLLFEYYILGYDLKALTDRRYIDIATLRNHFRKITEKLLLST